MYEQLVNDSPFIYIYIFTKNLFNVQSNECIEIVLKLMIHNSTGVFIESSGSVLNKLHIKIPEAFQSFFMVDIDKNSRDTYIQNISLDG